MAIDKRRRNARPSKYRPRTEAQKLRRLALKLSRNRVPTVPDHRAREADLRARMAELEVALRDQGHGGIHVRRNTRPLDEITDDAERFAVLKARVERLEALWTVDRRKRETRGKIVIGGAILAELNASNQDKVKTTQTEGLLAKLLDVLDRRVETVRDRLTVRELLGDVPLALRPGGALDEDPNLAIARQSALPDFDTMLHAAMGEEAD